MTRTSRWAHRASVALMAVTVLIATGDGFAQSYAGLYHWALEHSLHGWKAESFPLMVDLFILVGELGMFALALEGHKLTRRALSWADLGLPAGIAAGGWVVSLAFNVGAVRAELADQLTAAVPPIASMLGLVVLLRTLHRLVGRAAASEAPAETAAAEPVAGQGAPSWVFWPPFIAVDRDDQGAEEPGVPEIEAGVPGVPGAYPEIARPFVAELEQGRLPSYRVIKKRLGVGQDKAREVREELAVLVPQ